MRQTESNQPAPFPERHGSPEPIELLNSSRHADAVIVNSGVHEGSLDQERPEALARLRIGREIHFKIAGPVEDERYWQSCRVRAAAEATNPSLTVQDLGQLSFLNLRGCYANAELVVVPSLWGEPIGTAAAEAVVNGAAVIASRVGGIGT